MLIYLKQVSSTVSGMESTGEGASVRAGELVMGKGKRKKEADL